MNNVYDHSEDEIGAFLSWNFISNDLIEVSIGDSGIGIPEKVLRFHEKIKQEKITHEPNYKFPKTSKEAMKWAFTDRNTTRSTLKNQGRGLDIVHSHVKDLKMSVMSFYSGNIKLVLNKSFFTDQQSKSAYIDNDIKDFKGTIVRLVFQIDSLPSNEIQEFKW